jgi:hypothetical protein
MSENTKKATLQDVDRATLLDALRRADKGRVTLHGSMSRTEANDLIRRAAYGVPDPDPDGGEDGDDNDNAA